MPRAEAMRIRTRGGGEVGTPEPPARREWMEPMDDREELLPSQVRRRVLREHDELRAMIAEVAERADSARQDPKCFDEFAESARRLLERLRAHLELEDEILKPCLETIDAWGPERAKRLAAEHAHQRRVIDQAQAAITREHRTPLEIVAGMEQFMDRLEEDMELEEKTNLDEELLREYPVRVDFGGA